MFETFDHTADVGIRVQAPTLESLFAEAGRALSSLIVADLDSLRPEVSEAFEIVGDDREYLLFDWLNELLYAFDARSLLFCQFDISLDDSGLTATARGERLDDPWRTMDHEVKAITYHGLKLWPDGDGWLAEVIVDI